MYTPDEPMKRSSPHIQSGNLLQQCRSFKLNSRFSAFIAAIIFILFSDCSRHEADILATVGKRAITIDDFTERYETIRKKVNIPDNGEARNATLRNMIDEELLIAEAIRRGYREDSAGEHEKERLKIQGLLDLYLKAGVVNRIEPKEEELRTLYSRLNTKVKARHLYAASRKDADSLYSELQQGKAFEELAQETFKDPKLRDTGGSLGYFTVDEMDPAFEEASFSLPIGQISRPVRTAQGYSIIQVQDRIVKPLLTESEYARHREQLQEYCYYRKKKQAIQNYVDSLRQNLNIFFNDAIVTELLRLIKNRPANSTAEDSGLLPELDPILNQELVRSKIGVWDVSTFQKYAGFTSEGQQKWIRSRENLEDFIAGLVARSYMLSEAQNMGLQKVPSYEREVGRKMDDFLLKHMDKIITETTLIPEDTLRLYFTQHEDQYLTPEKIQLSEIALRSSSQAKEIKKILAEGKESFAEIARKYSIRKWSAENGGDIGAFSYAELGSYAGQIFPLEVGQWLGPVKMDSLEVFIKSTAKYPKQLKTYQLARPEIIAALKPVWRNKSKQDLLASIRARVKVVTYPKKLKTVRLVLPQSGNQGPSGSQTESENRMAATRE
jgi:parvulin-like peptidyl-prolyl isomerase